MSVKRDQRNTLFTQRLLHAVRVVHVGLDDVLEGLADLLVGDEALGVLAEAAVGLADLLLVVDVVEEPRHEHAELAEVHGAAAVLILVYLQGISKAIASEKELG